jgi:excisionase family DNA binding protein
MQKVLSEPWISIAEIEKHLGVHEESVRRWIKGRAMPAAKIGKVWRLKISEVDHWIRCGSGALDLHKPT